MRPGIWIVLFFISTNAFAGAQNASITKLMGSVQIFTNPSRTPHPKKDAADGSMALFEGEYFLVREAKVGDTLEQGNILRTKVASRARLVYDNGDQILVAPGTAYRIRWEPKTETDPALTLMYGKIRGVVSKQGPRGKFSLRTKVATLGVRGTDFFLSESPSGETLLSVIRGAVEMRTSANPKPVEVKMGFSATAQSSEKPTIAVIETSREEFGAIAKVSISPDEASPSSTAIEAPIAEKVASLEKKALEATTEDIRKYQPELFGKLSPTLPAVGSVEELNSKSVASLSEKAPSRPVKKKKPSRKDLDTDEESDPYRQYFKPAK